MAVIIPAIIPKNIPPGEREVIVRLRDDPETRDWLVLHSLDIARHPIQLSGEADFVVIIPALGVLVVEVKSHNHIQRGENGIWYFGSDVTGEARGPFRQAADAMHALRGQVKEKFPDLAGVVFWSCVIFPCASGRVVTGEWHPWQLVDSAKFRSAPLHRLLGGVLDSAHRFLREKGAIWFSEATGALGVDGARRIAACLRPSFELFQSPAARGKLLGEELKTYSDEQLETLDEISDNARLLVSGPAGSGKTLLAVESVRRSMEASRRTAFLCYNKFLSIQLGEATKGLTGLVCCSLQKLMCDLAKIHPRGNEPDAWWDQTLPDLATDAILSRSGPPLFEELVIDEFQDLLTTPCLDFIDLILEGGLSAGRWRAFGDFERQRIFHSAVPITVEQFRQMRSGNATYRKLNVNCRNLPRIARQVEQLGRLHPGYRNIRRSDDGVDPDFLWHKSNDEADQNLRKLLLKYEAAGFARRDIVVLSPTKECSAARIHQVDGNASILLPYPTGRSDCVQYGTIHSFKGLEAPVVILTDLSDVESNRASDLFYIGLSRSVQRLAVCAPISVATQLLTILQAR